MRFSRAGRRSPRIDISPLIDVVFQLLLFYAVTTQFVADERLKLQLPEAATAEREATQKPLVAEVVVSASGAVLVDGVAVADADLESTIAAVVQWKNRNCGRKEGLSETASMKAATLSMP